MNPEGPNLEENQSRLNAWKLQVFAWNFQSRLKTSISLEMFNLDLENSPQKKKGFGGRLAWNFQARLKFSSSLENVIRLNLAWKFQSRAQILIFFKIWALCPEMGPKWVNKWVWPIFGCVTAQAFFSRSAAEISLKSRRFFQRNLAERNVT